MHSFIYLKRRLHVFRVLIFQRPNIRWEYPWVNKNACLRCFQLFMCTLSVYISHKIVSLRQRRSCPHLLVEVLGAECSLPATIPYNPKYATWLLFVSLLLHKVWSEKVLLCVLTSLRCWHVCCYLSSGGYDHSLPFLLYTKVFTHCWCLFSCIQAGIIAMSTGTIIWKCQIKPG